MWGGVCTLGPVKPPTPRDRSSSSPQFFASPVFMPTPVNTERPNSPGQHIGRGVFFGGQPRHCMCTSASRGLSATAELLVCFRLTADNITKHLCMAESENSRVSVPLLVKRYCPRLTPLPTSFHFGRTICFLLQPYIVDKPDFMPSRSSVSTLNNSCCCD